MKKVIRHKMFYMELLNDWLYKEERSGSWLARKCGVSTVAVHYWITLEHFPSTKHQETIKELTGIEL